jgi:hypothetical protein
MRRIAEIILPDSSAGDSRREIDAVHGANTERMIVRLEVQNQL